MFNLFNKSKVRAGKQSKDEKKTVAASAAAKTTSKSPLQSLSGAWAKLNKMNRKQACTWGAVLVVGLIALLTLGSAVSSDEDDFSSFQTRGYDLANMPFSTDEAEQYLLANKYPDMKNNKPATGLYSKEEKEARQEQDAEEAAEKALTSVTSKAAETRSGRYYGKGGAKRTGAPTQVGKMNNASMGKASGSGLSGTFGAAGDFSNFRSQEKGYDKFTPQGPGKGDARKALFQSAMASRAAAGLKNDKLANAKKAMMGGNVKGDKAFMNDSGAVNLGDLKGLELDENAPLSSTDLSGLDDALNDANDDAAKDAADQDQKEWWEELLIDMAKQLATGLINMGMNMAQNEINAARAGHVAAANEYQQIVSELNANYQNASNTLSSVHSELESADALIKAGTPSIISADGSPTIFTRTDNGEILKTTIVPGSEGNSPVSSTVNLTQQEAAARSNLQQSAAMYNPMDKRPTVDQWQKACISGKMPAGTKVENGKVLHQDKNGTWEEFGTFDKESQTFAFNKDDKGNNVNSPKIDNKTYNKDNKYNTYIKDNYSNRLSDANLRGRQNAPAVSSVNNPGNSGTSITVGGVNYSGKLSSDGLTFTTPDGTTFRRNSKTSEWR